MSNPSTKRLKAAARRAGRPLKVFARKWAARHNINPKTKRREPLATIAEMWLGEKAEKGWHKYRRRRRNP